MITLNFKSKTTSHWMATHKHSHRLNGKPAFQSWYNNGKKGRVEYFEYGKMHRLNDKPARQVWYEGGLKKFEEYYEYGKFIDKGEQRVCDTFRPSKWDSIKLWLKHIIGL